jgi:hypothetical protein
MGADQVHYYWPSLISGIICIGYGLIIDAYNVGRTWLQFKGERTQSGILILPFVLYLLGTWALFWRPSGPVLIVGLVVHLACYFSFLIAPPEVRPTSDGE